jgi:hypothetical protein
MDAWERFGEQLGFAVTQFSSCYWEQVHQLIGRSRDRTQTEFLLFLTWSTTNMISSNLTAPLAKSVLDSMHRIVYIHARRLLHKEHDEFEKLVHNRYAGYYAAFQAVSGPQSIWNVTKYFSACCGALKYDVKYDEIVPDPEDIELLKHQLPEEFTTAYNEAFRNNPHVATYPLRVTLLGQIAGYSGHMAAVVQEMLKEIFEDNESS